MEQAGRAGAHPVNVLLAHLRDATIRVNAQSHPSCRQVCWSLVRLQHRCWKTPQGWRGAGRGWGTAGKEARKEDGGGAGGGEKKKGEKREVVSC